MRILHTSDWHLGRSFHGTGMLETQQLFIDALVETVRDEKVDVVLIAGDVYDRALPSVDAVEVLDWALGRIREAGAQIIITSGNHDSATRLGFGGHLMDAAGVYVRTQADSVANPVQLHDDDGTQLLVYGIPYLEPRLIAPRWETAAHHTAVLSEAIDRIRNDLEQRRVDSSSPMVSVVMAHVFAAGAAGSDSERDIGEGVTQGGLGQVPASVFEPADYTALGHLHGRQRITETVRYSGSPLPYSFSEARQAKGGWLLTLHHGEITAVDGVQWQIGRSLRVLEGEIEDLLHNPKYAEAEDAWCQITVTDPQRPPQAYARLKERFTGMLNFILAPTGPREVTTSYADKIDDAVSDLQICTDFVDHVRQRPATESETELLSQALEHSRAEDAEATR